MDFLKSINKIREPIYKNTEYWMLPIPIDRIILNSQTIWSLNIGKELSQEQIYKDVSDFVSKIENELIQSFLRIKLNSYKLFHIKKVTDVPLLHNDLTQLHGLFLHCINKFGLQNF